MNSIPPSSSSSSAPAAPPSFGAQLYVSLDLWVEHQRRYLEQAIEEVVDRLQWGALDTRAMRDVPEISPETVERIKTRFGEKVFFARLVEACAIAIFRQASLEETEGFPDLQEVVRRTFSDAPHPDDDVALIVRLVQAY